MEKWIYGDIIELIDEKKYDEALLKAQDINNSRYINISRNRKQMRKQEQYLLAIFIKFILYLFAEIFAKK